MDEQDKIAVIKLLLGQLTDNEKDLLNRRINNEPELHDIYENYRDIVQKIDVFYALKSIELKINSMDSLSDSKKIKSKLSQNKSNKEKYGIKCQDGFACLFNNRNCYSCHIRSQFIYELEKR